MLCGKPDCERELVAAMLWQPMASKGRFKREQCVNVERNDLCRFQPGADEKRLTPDEDTHDSGDCHGDYLSLDVPYISEAAVKCLVIVKNYGKNGKYKRSR